MDDELSVPQAAALLGVSEETVRRMVDAGQLRGYRTRPPGGWRRIYRSSVDEVLRQRRAGVGDAGGARAAHPDG